MSVLGRRAALASLVALALLLLAAPRPAEAAAQLRAATTAVDPVAPLVAAVALAAWGLALWLVVAAAVVLAARTPGAVGRGAAVLARRVAPLAVRRALELALGVTVTVAGTAAPAAAAAPALPSLDWPTLTAPAATASAAPDAPAPAASQAPPASGSPSPGPGPRDTSVSAPRAAAVVVAPGDSLWALAEAHLERTRGRSPTPAQVASAWPQWWSANREVVGDDPDLILPGTVLRPPGP